MLEKDFIQTKIDKNNHSLKNSYSSFNISKLTFNPLDKTLKTNLKANNISIINQIIKPKIKKLLIIKEENKLTKNNEKNDAINKEIKKIPIMHLKKSSGDIAYEKAKNNMTFYLNSDRNPNNDEINNTFINNIDKILNKKEKQDYIKEKENLFKNYNKLIMEHNKNNKKLNKCYSQGNIKEDIINENSSEEKSEKEQSLIFKRLTKTKINIDNYLFQNPLNSYNIIYQNKKIYNDILKNYKGTMISEYKKSINNLNPIIKLKSNKKSLQKVKILPCIAKSIEKNIEKYEPLDKFNLLSKFGRRKSRLSRIVNFSGDELGISKLLNKRNKLYLLKNIIQYPSWGFPESRIEFSFSQEGEDYIIFGGYNSNRISNLWKFNPIERSWSIIKEETDKNENRYGHISVLRNGNLYVFGGIYLFRKFFAGLEIFNLNTKQWSFPILNPKNKYLLRRNHIGCTIGNQMIIQGGIDEEEEYLNDFQVLNFQNLQWSLPVINKSVLIPSLAYHSGCLVLPQEVREDSKYTIYNFPKITTKMEYIKERGLYIFGGQVSKNGVLNKNLYVLKLGKKPLDWILLKTKGIAPSKRYGASMSYYELGNLLIIHGGRNNSGNYNYVLNDTFLLDLYSLNWMQVEYFDKTKKISPRFFHQSFVYENNFFVFGGTDGLNYLGSEMLILEMDSNKRCLRELEENNILKVINTTMKMKKNSSFNIIPLTNRY